MGKHKIISNTEFKKQTQGNRRVQKEAMPLNVVVQIVFEFVEVVLLFGLVMTVGESERQVNAGIRVSFLRLQRAKEVLTE